MAKASDNVFPKLIFSSGSAPATPSAGQGKVYEKSSDKKLYFKNEDGTEYDLTASGSGSLTVQDENSNVSTAVTQIDFQGAGVTASSGSGEVIVTIAGGGGSPTFVGCAAERTTTQSIASGALVVAQLNATDVYDTDSIHDPTTNNGRLTIPSGKAGKWRFTGTAQFASNGTGIRGALWQKNGASLGVRVGGQETPTFSGEDLAITTTVDLSLAVGDYIEFLVYQTSGAALNLNGAYVTCQFLG